MLLSLLRRVAPVVVAALVLALVAPLAAEAQYFGRNKITYKELDWKIYHSPHFDVYYYVDDDRQLERVVSIAESAYDVLSRRLDHQIDEPTPLIFYATHSDFQQNNIILNFIPEGVGAFASPVRFRMVLPVDLPDDELYGLMKHELTHIFQYHILFGGNVTRGVASRPPLWVMEGMASYLAEDETTQDVMFLRDIVVNDQIPPPTQSDPQGYFAYRYGSAVFRFMEERWGEDGLLDFIYELRNTLGARPGPAVERAFRIIPEDFDADFRRWLRRQYLPALVETGEPSDFGRRFRVQETLFRALQSSPVASPSGDLLAAFTTERGEVDIALFDTENRVLLENLTKGYTNDYEYIVAQEFNAARAMGRDLSFSPDGNTVAAFVKQAEGRNLMLLDILEGDTRFVEMTSLGLERQLAPAFSPDGRRVAFAGWRDGQFDIYTYDLVSGDLVNWTDDARYDGAPTWTPDGKSLVFTSVLGERRKLFRIDLDDPSVRYQLTQGDANDVDATFAPDNGNVVYFTSDRSGANNIWSLDLQSGELVQHTNAVTGAFHPTVYTDTEEERQLVYTGFWKGRYDLYRSDLDEPVGEPETVEVPEQPATTGELDVFEPDIQVVIDDRNKEEREGFRLFLEDAQTFAGVDDDQTFLGRILLTFSDYLGDRRIFANLSSVNSFSNFDIAYSDRSKRTQWAVQLYDQRDFFISQDFVTGQLLDRETAYRETGLKGFLIYPFDLYTRVEAGAGYVLRKYDFTAVIVDEDSEQVIPVITPREDDYPIVELALVRDTTLYTSWGPQAGSRIRFSVDYAPDFDESGTLTNNIVLDARTYLPVTQRSNFAMRLFAAASEGNFPRPWYVGGLDTVRGYDFRSITGNRAFYANAEFRFPLIDLLATPVVNFQGIRGVIFFDIGGAYWSDFEDFDFYDSDLERLDDAVASYGFGVTVRFLGLDLNWDLAKRYDLDTSDADYRSSFWIGTRF